MKGSPRVAILGAGLSGVGMAIQLKRAGLSSFTIYEKGEALGGTWRENHYPGAGCDVPSHLYSYSFAPRARWSRHYAEQPEILSYLEHCAERFGITDRIRYGTEIAGARFDDRARVWCLTTRAGEAITADVVVSGLGQLNRPSIPRLPGLESFAGRAFHSARWDHSFDVAGKRVAVVGTGASAVQFVPHIAPKVARLTIFQRSPNWIVPRNDAAYSEGAKRLFGRVPAVRQLHRGLIYWASEARFLGLGGSGRRLFGSIVEYRVRRTIEQQIADPALRAKLVPSYPLGCKRVLVSDDYYPALARPNVDLVTEGIERVVPQGVVTADGAAHAVDAIVFGTGFESLAFLV